MSPSLLILFTTLVLPSAAQEPAPDDTAPDAAGEAAPALVKAPELMEFVEAPYPPEAEAAGLEGVVRLRVAIDELGAVQAVELMEPIGHGFDEAAVEAVQAFTFAPAETAEGPVPVVIEFAYGFELQDEPAPADPAVLPIAVQGLLREKGTRQPIAGAHVVVEGAEAYARSDEQGRFELRAAPVGALTLLCRSPGHEDLRVEIERAQGEQLDLELWLRASSYSDYEALGLYQVEEQDVVVTRRTVSMEEVRRVPGTFGDPVRVIQTLPGAARTPFGTSDLIIRGGDSGDTNVYVDGVEVPIIYHLGGFRSVINPDLVEAVDYLPGAQPLRYGQSISGSVDVRTKQDWDEGWQARAQADLLDSSATVRGRFEQLPIGLAGAFRASYLDLIMGLMADRTGDASIAPSWRDYQLQAQSLVDGPDSLRLLAFGFWDDMNIVRGDAEEEPQLTTRYASHRVLLDWTHREETFSWMLQPSLGWDEQLMNAGTVMELGEQGLRFGLRAEGRWMPSERFTLLGGLDAGLSQRSIEASAPEVPNWNGDTGSSIEETEAIEEDVTGWIGSPDPYLELQLRPLPDPDRLSLSAGLRLATMLRTDGLYDLGWEPRGSLRVGTWKGGTLKGGAGLYHQVPDATAMAFSEAVDFDMERAWTAEAGIEQRFGEQASLDVVGYYRGIDQLMVRQDSDPGTVLYENAGLGRAYGVETILRKQRTGPLFGWLSYTWSVAERDEEASGDWVLYELDQTHNLVAVTGYTLPLDFDLSAKFQYTSGNPYTPYDDATYDLDSGRYSPTSTLDENSARLEPYWALDLRASKLWTFDRWQLDTYVDLLNVLHGENPELIQWSYDYTEHDNISGLGFYLNPGLELRTRF